jgi:hypothetical protein
VRPEEVGADHKRGAPRKYFLSRENRELLLAEYDSETSTVTWLSQELGVPRKRLHHWAMQLGINKRKPRWTSEDDRMLESLYCHMYVADIAKKLERSEKGVRMRAHHLGINKRTDGYTQNSLCLALGCTHRLSTQWIKRGWLKATRRKTKHQADDLWHISDNALRSFIKQHPSEIDLSKVDQLWFIDLAFGVLNRERSQTEQDPEQNSEH